MKYKKPTRKWLLLIVCICTFPISLFVALGMKIYEGSNHKLGVRQGYAKFINFVAGGTFVEYPLFVSGNRKEHSGTYGEHSSKENYGKEKEANVGLGLNMLKQFANYKVFNSFYLKCESYYQEIDHLVIGKNGVFHIETKAHKGDITINTDGSWTRIIHDKFEKLDNPASQIDMHGLIINKILGNKYIVNNIIAMASDINDVHVSNKANCKYPIVHYKDLQSYILEFNSGTTLSDEEIENITNEINKHYSKEKPNKDNQAV